MSGGLVGRRTTITVISVGLAVAGLSACAGVDLGDLVRVQTPPKIQQQTGLPASMTLNEAEAEYHSWFEMVTSDGARWKQSISRGSEIEGALNQLTLQSLSDVGPTVQGLPVVGPAAFGLLSLATYFVGSGSRRSQQRDHEATLRAEKEASYNAGRKAALADARAAAGPSGPQTLGG